LQRQGDALQRRFQVRRVAVQDLPFADLAKGARLQVGLQADAPQARPWSMQAQKPPEKPPVTLWAEQQQSEPDRAQ